MREHPELECLRLSCASLPPSASLPTPSAPVAHHDGPEAIVQRRELADLLQRHIANLPIDQRTVLVLSDVHGLSYGEIAAITRLRLGTVKSRLSRGRARLRDDLEPVLPLFRST